MRFIKVYGSIIIVMGIGCIYTLFVSSYNNKQPIYNNVFVITITAWYLITGIGIISMQKWGYYLFKLFLYVLFLAFPIGTIISFKSLKYMKSNDIKNHFFNNK